MTPVSAGYSRLSLASPVENNSRNLCLAVFQTRVKVGAM